MNKAGQPVGDWSTLRNLTLNGNVGQVAVPPGTYGDFTAGGGGGFTVGVAGATEAAVYNFQSFNFNGQSQLRVVGPVVINLKNGFSANGQTGSAEQPAWRCPRRHRYAPGSGASCVLARRSSGRVPRASECLHRPPAARVLDRKGPGGTGRRMR